MAEMVLERGPDSEEDTQKGKFLTFRLENEYFGIEIRFVTEIVGIQDITSIPEFPDYVRGIINLRGRIIPVIDVRLRFGKEFREYDNRTCIIVVDINGSGVGMIVDAVDEVMRIHEEDIVPPPELSKEQADRYIYGIGKAENRVMLLLDCNRLISETIIDDLEKNVAH